MKIGKVIKYIFVVTNVLKFFFDYTIRPENLFRGSNRTQYYYFVVPYYCNKVIRFSTV